MGSFKLVRVKVCAVVSGPTEDDDDKERKRFSSDFGRVLERISNTYYTSVMRGAIYLVRLKFKVRMRLEGMENFFSERRLCVGNTYFNHNNVQKY